MARSTIVRRFVWLASRRTRIPGLLLAVSGMALCLSGCVATDFFTHKSQKDGPAQSPVSEVSMVWKGLAVTQDSVNGGRPLPGLAGRMYLIGPEMGAPKLCDGTVVVEMSAPDEKGEMKVMERWQIDPVTLKRLARKDVIGNGYTLFLPWSSYSPTLTQAQMRVTFIPTGVSPIYGPPAMVNIRPQAPIPIQEYVGPRPTEVPQGAAIPR